MLMTTLIIGLLIPLLGTMLGSAFVFFMKNDMPERVQKSLLGFASGVMVAASVWSKNSFQKPLQAVTPT
jgi:ZIP family zinc transporter